MKKIILLTGVIFLINDYLAHAEVVHPDFTFGNIKAADFSLSNYLVDTTSAAIYLFDIGSTYFHENESIHYEEVYQRRMRIRILDKNAFDLATLIIPLYNDDEDEQKIEDLQAATYNLVNGKVIAEPIDKNSVFKEKMKGLKVIKLTLPGVKEGCIIEFAYVIKTPGIHIPGWNFQDKYPVLWSEYEATIPYFYNYSVIKQGDLSFTIDSTSTYHSEYSYHTYKPTEDNTLQHEWVMQNVPALVQEPYVNTLKNYAAKLEFQLSAYQNASGTYITNNPSWFAIAARVLTSTSFIAKSNEDKKKINNEVKEALRDCDTSSSLSKASFLFKYVRDHYTCTDWDDKYLSQEQSKTIDSKHGNVADINLLLMTMLTSINQSASPVLISTKDNGKIVYDYPLLSKYNYLVCQVVINKKQYLLDASHKYLPFGRLASECYNGYARVIDLLNSQGIIISPNSLNESVTTVAYIGDTASSAVITTSLSEQPSIELKQELANSIQNKNLKKAEYIFLDGSNITDSKTTGLFVDSNIVFNYKVPLNFNGEDVIYFSPLLTAQINSNPFAEAKRKYPIELDYSKEINYQLTMEIPIGYEVDELPKSYQLKLGEDAGLLDYAIDRSGNTIHLLVRIKLAKAIYETEEYQMLRDWYTAIIKKEAEQIVFKKIK